VKAIIEHKDATTEQRMIREVYTGVMAVPNRSLKPWLARLTNDNAQGEYYLTDIVKLAVADGVDVVAAKVADRVQVDGVNSPVQLAELERAYQLRLARTLMDQGVRLADPTRFDVRGELLCGQDVEIDVNCVFEGSVSLGQGVRVGANCFVANAIIADGAVIHPFTHIDGEKAGVHVGEGSLIGPFARLRPGAQLAAEVHIGNFVEVKNSTMARGAKANHLAYLGDATVGERGQLRCGEHHGQLRWREQAPHRHRRRCPCREQLRAGRACAAWQGRHDCRRIDHHSRHATGGLVGGPRQTVQHQWLEPARENAEVLNSTGIDGSNLARLVLKNVLTLRTLASVEKILWVSAR
jgi:NDP-sugar pyrophosphorylase family protein